jgi:hypothetical protein
MVEQIANAAMQLCGVEQRVGIAGVLAGMGAGGTEPTERVFQPIDDLGNARETGYGRRRNLRKFHLRSVDTGRSLGDMPMDGLELGDPLACLTRMHLTRVGSNRTDHRLVRLRAGRVLSGLPR